MKTPQTFIARNEATAELCQSRNGHAVLSNLPLLLAFIFCLLFSLNGLAQSRDTSRKLIRHDTTVKSKPLIVVDGIIYNGDLKSIDPNDISSITVLKDPGATNIYGPQGANGVVIIQTKQYKKHSYPSQPLDSVVSKDALFVIDGVPSKNKLNDIDSKDIFSLDILKKGKGSDPSFEPVRDVVIVVTKAGATRAYQKKFSTFSKEYKQYINAHRDDGHLTYIINGIQVSANMDEKIRSLYGLKADSIKNIVFTSTPGQDSVSVLIVAIATK